MVNRNYLYFELFFFELRTFTTNLLTTNYVLIVGNPIAGTGAGLRPIGKDPNFVEDLREIFNISVPILHEGDETNSFKVTKHTGNGKNKWPNPQYVTSNWREVVSKTSKKYIVSINLRCKML